MDLKDIKALKKLAEALRLSTLELENLKDELVFRNASGIKDNKSSLSLKPRLRARSTYGCYDPLDRRQHKYKCASCREIVVTDKGYKATAESAGYIFICPDCKTPEFDYHYDRAR